MLDLSKLNKDQQQAVENTQGPLLVLAGAGTGKTTVITYKIAYLLEQGLHNSNNILAVTFTNKAASQMQSRVENLCGQRLPYIGTFHSIALRILRTHAELVGLKNDLIVIDYNDQIKILKNIYLDHKLDNNKLDHKTAHYMITSWKDLNLLSNEVETENKMALSIYNYYQQYLKNSNLVDFSDILLYVNNIFAANHDIHSLYQDKFKYVLVDEYQDTNKSQYDWIKLIAGEHQNICCVGDDDQSIYSWRGAQISNILNFSKEFPKTQIITLSQNYRSTQVILDAAQSIIAHNQNRYGKNLISGRDLSNNQVTSIRLIECINIQNEAEFIVQELPKLLPKYTAAVLVRTNFQTRILEDVFMRHKVNYTIIGSVKFYELKEIKDAVSYIRASINFNDDVAIERIINTPKRSIGMATLANIRQYAINQKISMFESTKALLEQNKFTKKASAELENFINCLTKWQNYFKTLAASVATQKVLEESGYMNMLNQNVFELQRVENIKELLKAIADHATIYEFIDYISLVSSLDNAGEDEIKPTVKIMTVHAAKGLEFDAVFLPNWVEGVLPSPKALVDENPNALEEERRISYVGITRAKNFLYISYSAYAKGKENYYINQERSRFIDEIDQKLLSKEHFPNFKAQSTSLFPGTKVMHKVFGYGLIVRSIDSTKYEVGFKNNGIKTIHKDFLNIAS
jgi:DNA helicase-2/ATP-dependent DNA helicase PcrA